MFIITHRTTHALAIGDAAATQPVITRASELRVPGWGMVHPSADLDTLLLAIGAAAGPFVIAVMEPEATLLEEPNREVAIHIHEIATIEVAG